MPRTPAPSRPSAPSLPLEIIGWTEHVELPDWGVPRLKAKVDTGARTSALHVDEIQRLPGDHVRFDVVLSRRKKSRRVTVEAPILRRTRVKSSTGVYRNRFVVPVRIRLGHVDKTIEVSLVSRDRMLFRMLLGRSAFSGDFLIDASRQCIQGIPHAAGRDRREAAAREPESSSDGAPRPRKSTKTKKKAGSSGAEGPDSSGAAPRSSRSARGSDTQRKAGGGAAKRAAAKDGGRGRRASSSRGSRKR